MTREPFTSYTFGEATTRGGQAVTFTSSCDSVARVREFLETDVRTIDVFRTGQVNIAHGGYGRYTRYDITQHEYAGCGPGECGFSAYMEVLEIMNPPDNRWGIVIHEWNGRSGDLFTEWETVDQARSAHGKRWGTHREDEEFKTLPGFKRMVACGQLTPWFYAIGDQQLVGDYAFPEGLQDDPVYGFGKQFVVFDENGIPSVKTCMGTRFFKRKSDYPSSREQKYRLVYFDDGSVWDESYQDPWFSKKGASAPRPLLEGEAWITEAVRQFRELLSGKSTSFTIEFTDGNKFVGTVKPRSDPGSCVAGDYNVAVKIKGISELKEGWVHDFEPSPESPDIVTFVTKQCLVRQQEVEYVSVKAKVPKKGGRKWAGAFYSPVS